MSERALPVGDADGAGRLSGVHPAGGKAQARSTKFGGFQIKS